MGFPLRILILVFYIVGIFAGSITVQERQPILYDSVSPKLRIQGTGFQSGTSVKLTIVPPLTQGQEYNLEVTSDTVLTLILKSKRKWAQVSQEQPQVTLYLSALEIDGTNQLAGTVPIASVIGTPTVTESSQVIYHQSTPALAINGTSLSKVHALVFDPQLAEGTDYTIAKHSYDQILVVLKSGRAWRQEPGPLVLARIDCGGGLLQLSPSTKGVRVAEVQADLDGHGIEVVTNKEAIYQSTPTVMITGSGFNPEGTKLRFYNNLRGSGANYTTIAATPNSLTLQLNPGVKWRENVRQLPGPLTVLAADGGAGWVALGATAAKRGRTIATVFEDPAITPQDTELWQTHSHHLTVTGKGFVMGQRPLLTTTPPLTYGEQYSVTVLNRTAMVLELALDASWCAAPCDLSVLSINTGAGEVALKTGATAGVKIAHVIGDAEAHASGLAVTRSVDLLYQSAHYKPLTIKGAGFVNTMTLMFYPPLMAGEDYTMAVTSGAELTLTLVEGKKWRPDHGPLLLFSVDPDGPEGKEAPVVMGSGAGMQVANILKDPVVEEQTNHIYESHTTMLTIKGSGFSGGFSVGEFPIALQLTPTKSSDFEIVSNTDTVITLKLKPGKKWAGVGHDKTTQLKIKAIDSGAGEEQFKPPIEIAEVHSDLDDDEKGQCDDTCVYALDGECDEDGRGTYYGSWYNEMYGGLEDDDYYSSYYRSSYTSDYGYYGYGYAGYGSLGYSTLNGLAPCDPGTDCTDCGGLRAGDSAPECENTCMFARDGYCDDPRGNDLCKAGSDCQDCGPRSASNFTDHWDTQWFDEDDDFFYDYEEGLSWWDQPTARPAAVDAAAAGGAGAQAGAGGGGGGGGGAKAQQPSGGGDGGSGAMGIITGLVYLLGFGGLAGGAFVAYQYYRGRPIPYLQVPQAEGGDVEMSSGRFRGPITPDVVHTGDEDRSD